MGQKGVGSMDEFGTLTVRVYTSRAQQPVEGAAVETVADGTPHGVALGGEGHGREGVWRNAFDWQ